MRRVVPIIVALFLLLILFDRFVLVELLVRRIAIPLLFAIAGALACVGSGFVVRRGARDVALNLLLGVPFFGTLCFLVGLINISKWTMVPLLGVLGGLGLICVGQALLPVRTGKSAGPTLSTFPLIAIAAVGVSAFLAAQAPPASLDELAYHLAVPWTWVKEGRAIELPLNSHSYFPLGVESADLPFLTILGTSGGLASHFLHLFAAAATTMLLFRAARRDLLIVAAIVATPALALTAGWSLVDWILLGEALALVSALEADDAPTVAAAFAAGLLTKYTFIPIAVIAIASVWRRASRPPWAAGAAAPTLLFGFTFFIRNLILTGNPVAPFLTSLAPHVAHYRLGAFLSDYIFDGRFVDESLGVSMLMTCVLTAGLLSWILIAAGVALFLLAPSARLLVPFFAIPATRALPPGRTMRVLIAIAIAAQLFLIAFFVDRTETFALLAGRLSDEQYLTRARPSTMTIASLDAALPDTSRTLVIGLTETFWFRHRIRGGGNFDGPRLSHYLDTGTADALYARLKRDGITHVAVVSLPPASRVAKKIEERETDLSPAAQRTLAQTLDHYASTVVSRANATLFTLR
jgi:hypothetical protein